MSKEETFQQFLSTQSLNIPIIGFIISLIITAILAYILSKFYVKYGKSLSNRKIFAENFILITVTTMLIITVVKSSLALSLGLVGALSIIRFRVAIKEPEELAYLFLCIAIGLGFGANQGAITSISLAIILVILWAKHLFNKDLECKDLNLDIQSSAPQKVSIDNTISILKNLCEEVELKRYDVSDKFIDMLFAIDMKNPSVLNNIKKELQLLDENIQISFTDLKVL